MTAFDHRPGSREIRVSFFLVPSLAVLFGSFAGAMAMKHISLPLLEPLLVPLADASGRCSVIGVLRETIWMAPVFFAGFFSFSCLIVSVTAFLRGFQTGYALSAFWRVLSAEKGWREVAAFAVPAVLSFPVFLFAGALACTYQYGSGSDRFFGKSGFSFPRYVVLMLLLTMLFFLSEIGGRAIPL